MKLQLGCGRHPLPGYLNTDIRPLPGVDQIIDMEKPLPFPDNTFEEIYGRACIEHVYNIQQLMAELWRISKPDGIIRVMVPHPSNIFTFRDWTHVRFFTLHTFDFYIEGTPYDYYYPGIRFEIVKRELEFTTGRFAWLNFISWVINRHPILQDIWERFCWLLPMDNIWFTLRVKKEISNGWQMK